MSDWTKALAVALPAINALIEWAAEQIGESTDTVRKRVLSELAKPGADPTDTEAKAIDDTWPGESDR